MSETSLFAQPVSTPTLESIAALISPEAFALLTRIGEAAADQQTSAYLIGGVIRDLALGIPSVDLDVMVMSDCSAFVKSLALLWPERFADFPPVGKPVVYEKYKTAKLFFRSALPPGITQLDFSMARAERFDAPAAVPAIAPGTLESDLARRDFSVNAMALPLSGSNGALIDHANGLSDLQRGVLRVLHDRSFVDDPARMIRAVRFQTRFGFALEVRTRELFTQALGAQYLTQLQPARLFDEFRKSLQEPNPQTLLSLDTCGILRQISPEAAGFDHARFIQLYTASFLQLPDETQHWHRMLGLLGVLLGGETLERFLVRFKRPIVETTAIIKVVRSVPDVH